MTVHFVHLLDQLRRRSLRMAALVADIVEEACEAVFADEDTLARRVVARDNEVDNEEVEVEAEVIRLLALYQPVGPDLRLLCTVLKVNNDLERIADCAVNMAERAGHLDAHDLPACSTEVKQMCPVVRGMLHQVIRAYGDEDADAARQVVAEDEAVDALYGQVIRSIVANASETRNTPASHLDMLSVAKNLESIADHATNIAEDVIFLCTGQIIRHQQK